MRFVIDAGHGLYTSGKRCMKKLDPNETREWTLNQRIASKVVELLKTPDRTFSVLTIKPARPMSPCPPAPVKRIHGMQTHILAFIMTVALAVHRVAARPYSHTRLQAQKQRLYAATYMMNTLRLAGSKVTAPPR